MCDRDETSQRVRQALTGVRLSLTRVGSHLSGRRESTTKGLGYRVAARDVDCRYRDDKEWLFDVVWMSLAWEPRQLGRIHLVIEVEWGNCGDIMDDFDKLLVARSDVRLMIFQASNQKQVEEPLSLLKAEAQGFEPSQTGDYHLLAGYDCENSTFLWREFSIQ